MRLFRRSIHVLAILFLAASASPVVYGRSSDVQGKTDI